MEIWFYLKNSELSQISCSSQKMNGLKPFQIFEKDVICQNVQIHKKCQSMIVSKIFFIPRELIYFRTLSTSEKLIYFKRLVYFSIIHLLQKGLLLFKNSLSVTFWNFFLLKLRVKLLTERIYFSSPFSFLKWDLVKICG